MDCGSQGERGLKCTVENLKGNLIHTPTIIVYKPDNRFICACPTVFKFR